MKTLVTGGTGFTGSHLVHRLRERGHEVTVLDNQKGLFDEEIRKLGAEIHYGEITDPEICDRLTRGQEIVFHLAAAFRGVNLAREVYWRSNVEGVRVIAEASLKNQVRRFIYCSTEGVHGKVDHPPADESAPIAPKDYYEYTKYEGEKVVRELEAKGLRAVILRPTAIYGPGDVGRYLILYRWARKGYFPMFGTGRIHYHPVYIDNLSDAFELAMENERALGQAYLIGDEHYVSLNDLVHKVGEAIDRHVRILHFPYTPFLAVSCLVEWVCKPMGITPPLFRRRAEWYWENRGFSIEKAKQELGYHPRIGLEEGLRRTGAWYHQHGYL